MMKRTEEQKKSLAKRNWMILYMIIAFMVLIYVITIVQMGKASDQNFSTWFMNLFS